MGDLLFASQEKNVLLNAVMFVGNLLCEVDNPDLGQRVLKETRLFEFLT